MGEPFTLQLHITDACELQCRHCYRDTPRRADLPLTDLERMLDDFHDFCESRWIPGRVTFAGGEPLQRVDDLLLLTRRAKKSGMQVHLLTNGWHLTRETAQELKAAGCLRVQISLDGDAETHDGLRGGGAFEKAIAALVTARQASLPATLSLTLGGWNRQALHEVIRLAQEHCARLFVSRFVPCGNGAALRNDLLTPNQWQSVMRRCSAFSRSHSPGVSLRDPLYAPLRAKCGHRNPMAIGGCAIGHAGLAVDADGTAYPCRRLPVPLGNLRVDGFEAVWRSPALEALRDRDRLRGPCGACQWRWACGGCRAIAYALSGDPFAGDPQCCWS